MRRKWRPTWKKGGVKWTTLCSASRSECVLKLRGELDGASACEILRTLETMAQRGTVITLDGSGIRSATSFGVSILEKGIKRLTRAKNLIITRTKWGKHLEEGGLS